MNFKLLTLLPKWEHHRAWIRSLPKMIVFKCLPSFSISRIHSFTSFFLNDFIDLSLSLSLFFPRLLVKVFIYDRETDSSPCVSSGVYIQLVISCLARSLVLHFSSSRVGDNKNYLHSREASAHKSEGCCLGSVISQAGEKKTKTSLRRCSKTKKENHENFPRDVAREKKRETLLLGWRAPTEFRSFNESSFARVAPWNAVFTRKWISCLSAVDTHSVAF